MVENESVPAVVEKLEELLTRAKTGEIQSLAYSCSTAEFTTLWGWECSKELRLSDINWDLDRLKHELQTLADENARKE